MSAVEQLHISQAQKMAEIWVSNESTPHAGACLEARTATVNVRAYTRVAKVESCSTEYVIDVRTVHTMVSTVVAIDTRTCMCWRLRLILHDTYNVDDCNMQAQLQIISDTKYTLT